MTPPPCAPASRRAARTAATLAPWRGSSVRRALRVLCVACTVPKTGPDPRIRRRGTRAPGKPLQWDTRSPRLGPTLPLHTSALD